MFGTKMILVLLSIIVAVSAAQNSSTIMVFSKSPTPSPTMSTRTLPLSTSAIASSSVVAPPSVSTSISAMVTNSSTAITTRAPPLSTSAIASSSMVASPSVSTSISAMVTNSSTMTTNSSIAPSSATTTHAISSTPVPTTPKPPKYNVNAIVKDNTSHPCLWFEASIVINYMYYNGTTKMIEKIVVEQKDLKNVTGVCSSFNKSEQYSYINLTEHNNRYQLSIQFESEKSGWIFSKIDVTIDIPNSNEALRGELNLTSSSNNGLFSALKDHCYRCDIGNSLDLTSYVDNTTISVVFQKVYVQPFKNNGTKTDDANVCPSGEKPTKSSSVVPIAVGCALAGLIVIVLIAYLIGRRRSDAKGYQQV